MLNLLKCVFTLRQYFVLNPTLYVHVHCILELLSVCYFVILCHRPKFVFTFRPITCSTLSTVGE